MGRLGVFIIMTAFLGVAGFVVLGASRNMRLAILTHVGLVAGVSIATIIRKKSLRKAWQTLQEAEGFGALHPAFILFIGIVFVVGGFSISNFMQPGTGPDAMNQGDQIYFGCLFAGMGAGVSLIACNVWRNLAREKRRNPFVSDGDSE